MRSTVASAVVDSLARAGVREVFGVAGGALTPLLHALHDHPTLTYTGVRHEAAAAHMAAATAHATTRPAACLAEQGTSHRQRRDGRLARARRERAADGPRRHPRLGRRHHLAPRRPLPRRRRHRHPRSPAPGRLRPPRTHPCGHSPHPPRRPSPRHRAGAARARAEHLVRAVVDQLGAAAAGTQMGIGVVPSDGDTFVGHGGVIGGPALIRAIDEADVILAVGCRFSSWWWQHGQRLGQQATLIQVDTDPSLKPTLLGDISTILTRLSTELLSRAPNSWVRGLRREFLASDRPAVLDVAVRFEPHPMMPAFVRTTTPA